MRLIDGHALIAELNNSHFPGAPYIDAGINIAIGKVCDAPTIELQQWIPVSEKMPPGQENVIVSVMDTHGDTPFYYTSFGWTTTDGEYWIVDNEICYEVVAWMPLPDPWKEYWISDAVREEQDDQ